jgi:LCP family protein required for cell wall assembly
MPNKTKKKFLPTDRKSQIILGVLVLLGLLAGFGVRLAASNFVASMTILNLPGEPVIDESVAPVDVLPGEPTSTPTVAPPPIVAMPEPWDGKTRVNMLVMGVDARSPDATAPLSDTMILFTFDPVSNTAGMLSIPRDMWVKIPGGEYAKINTAFSIGEALKLPGGGPALATETVENFLGVPIQYYAQIDFESFIDFIDHIAGVKLTIEAPIDLAFVDTGDFVSLEPGRYTLNGSYALAYVRNRDGGDGDIDRAKRQQQVILAVRDRLVEFNMLPQLLANSDQIYQDISRGLKTNLDFGQALSLARRVLEIDRSSIQHFVIDTKYVNYSTSPNGLSILRPIPDKIRELRDQVFYGATVSPETAAKTLQNNIQQENARVSIINGSNTSGLETITAEYLGKQGLQITNAAQGAFQGYTSITIYGAKPHTAKYLIDLMKIAPTQRITYAYDPAAAYDLVVTVGDDWVSLIPAQ